MSRIITAAGGLVFSEASGKRRVLVIHRPRYDDWSFPKGKHDHDAESDEDAALREIEEETSVIGRVLTPLETVEYSTGNGNLKRVTYFAVRAVERPEFSPNPEVDEIRWVKKRKALELLTYDFDRELLERSSLRRLASIGEVHLVRHAAAGDRNSWRSDDRLRPISGRGRRQATALADRLATRHPDEILSSPYVRCVQTVEPLAKRLGKPIETTDFLAEGSGGAGLIDYVSERPGREITMVSHGDVIPAIVDRLGAMGVPLSSSAPDGRLDCKKGSDWVLTTRKGRIVSARYLPPPSV